MTEEPTIDYESEIERLADEYERGPLRFTAPLEEAIRLADANRDVRLGIALRSRFIRGSFIGSFPERAIAAFTWMQGQLDRKEEITDPYVVEQVVDAYFYVSQTLPLFVSVTRDQIRSLLDEMRRDFETMGYETEPVDMMRLLATLRMGDRESAEADLERWRDARRDLWRCDVCVADLETHALLVMGRDHEAIAKAMPWIEQRPRCDDPVCNIDVQIMSRLLVPLYDAGSRDVADELAPRVGSGLGRHADDSILAGQLVEYLALVGRFDEAIPVVERTADAALETSQAWYVLHWRIGLATLAHRAAATDHGVLPIRLPESFEQYRPDGRYDPAEIAESQSAIVAELCDRFDTRNGNGFHRAMWDRCLERLGFDQGR